MKLIKKIGRFELVQTNRSSFAIRVYNDNELAPAAVTLYEGSGQGIKQEATRIFTHLTDTWCQLLTR